MKLNALLLKLSLSVLGVLAAQPAWAVLPTAVAPSTGAANNNYLDTAKGYIKDGGLLVGLALALSAFLWISYHILQDLHEWRTGRKEGGQLLMSVIAGGGALLMVIFLANQAATVV